MYFTEPMDSRRKPHQHRVLMNVMLRDGYHISFLKEDCKTSLPLKLTFRNPAKILEMQERWGEDRSEDRNSEIRYSLEIGRPTGIWLIVSEEQFRKLLGRKE